MSLSTSALLGGLALPLCLLAGCATADKTTTTTTTTTMTNQASSGEDGASAMAAQGPSVRLRFVVPDGLASDGVVVARVFTADELARKVHQDPAHIATWMARAQRVLDQDPAPDVVVVEVPLIPEAGGLQLTYDVGNNGLEILFGRRPGLADAFVEVSGASAGIQEITLTPPPPPRPEPCAGPRLRRIDLEAPELARPGDPGVHQLCVQLPEGYDDDIAARYPVIFAFPGFSGFAAMNDSFNARGIFDEAARARGGAVIMVGVETRTPEGTSYLSDSDRYGHWARYVVDRVLPEVDARFRTNGRRAAIGHSTGGWNALSIATRFPDRFTIVGASAPDPLDLRHWLLDDQGAIKPCWRAWIHAETQLGTRGQFHSWSAAWSQTASPASSPKGAPGWIVDATGALDDKVLARWEANSPLTLADTPAGRAALQRLSGRLFLTAGRGDQFDLFTPTERYVTRVRALGVEVMWVPTDAGHFGDDRTRFGPMADFVLEALLR